METEHGYLRPVVFDRWIIAKATNPDMAWSGSRWVQHTSGIGEDVQVSNFASRREALQAACDYELVILLTGFLVEQDRITCFTCGMTSYNRNDIETKYCGACHEFHERA